MSALLDAVAHPAAVWAGWTALIVLWQSLVVALALAAWRAARVSASAEVQHRAALAALALCVAGLVATPVVLASWPAQGGVAARPRVVAVGGARTVVPSAGVLPTAPPTAASIAPAPPSLNVIAGAAGLVWLAGSAVLLVRLAGGWWMAGRVRARAVRVSDGEVLEALRGMPGNLQPLCGVDVLESSEVEAPVVIGARRPALIVPNDLGEQLGPAALAPLLAHECAHVRRADYAANVAQSAAEALLFFSPAVRWISRVVRETREYCCDDIAIDWCGEDRGGYVRALTGLASLGSRNRMQPALGAAGPRLITRVRRLLGEDDMRRSSLVRVAALTVVSVCLMSVGGRVVALSARQAAGASAGSSTAWNIPIGYATGQPGSSVVLGPVLADATHLAATITIKNEADIAVSSITLVGIVRGRSNTGAPGPLAIVQGEPIAASIAPGATGTVAANFLTREQLAPAEAKVGPARLVFFGIERVAFANGADWSMAPNPAARYEWEALSLPPAQVPRRLIASAPRTGPWQDVCESENGSFTSEGGVVAVSNEPGRWAVCRNGVWLDHDFRSSVSAASASQAQPTPTALPVTLLPQKGPSVTIREAHGNPVHLVISATVENVGTVPVSSVGIAAFFGQSDLSKQFSMEYEVADVAIAPGATQTIPLTLLDRARELSDPGASGRQVYVVLGEVHYVDGTAWEMRLDPKAASLADYVTLAPSAQHHPAPPTPGADTTHPAPVPPTQTVMPVVVREVKPRYLPELVKSGPQGNVIIDIVVDVNGKVTKTKVVKSLSPELDAEAVKAAKQWEFKPGTKGGKPVEVKTSLEFTFTTR